MVPRGVPVAADRPRPPLTLYHPEDTSTVQFLNAARGEKR